jgi:hypothetical protein
MLYNGYEIKSSTDGVEVFHDGDRVYVMYNFACGVEAAVEDAKKFIDEEISKDSYIPTLHPSNNYYSDRKKIAMKILLQSLPIFCAGGPSHYDVNFSECVNSAIKGADLFLKKINE